MRTVATEPTTRNNRQTGSHSPDTLSGLAESRHRLRLLDLVPVVLAIVVIAAVTIPRLPPGICFSDAGDLQVASITLGIMHPPGYAGYVSLAHLATLLPGMDSAYSVSLSCLASGIVALLLCILMQVRLGVNPWIASALVLALTAHKRVWTNLVEPEVYAPSLFFVAASAYLLVTYARTSVRRNLFIAATLFGFVLANRPTVVWMLPFFLVAWWAGREHRHHSRRRSVNTALCATVLAALPGLYSLSYLWVRDTPQTAYNYVEQKNTELNILPDTRDGWEAKAERLYWLATAREFERYMGNTGHGIFSRLGWLYKEFFLYRYVEFLGIPMMIGQTTFVIVVPILSFGAWYTYRRCRTSFWALIGMFAGTVAFICTYRIYGQAADLLPLIFAATVFAGVALTPLFPAVGGRARSAVAAGLLLAVCGLTFVDAPHRGRNTSADAAGFVTDLDMQTLPRNTAILSTWHHSTALWYAQHVLTKREDIEIVNTPPSRWREEIEARSDRPVLVVMKITRSSDFTLTPYRNVWRVERPGKMETPPPGSK